MYPSKKNCRFCFDKDENCLFFMQKAFLFLPQNYPFEKMSHFPLHFVSVRDRKRFSKEITKLRENVLLQNKVQGQI